MPGGPSSAATSPTPCSPASRPRSVAAGIDRHTLGPRTSPSHSGAGGFTIIRDADGNLLDTRDDVWTGEFERRTAAASCSTGRAARSATSTLLPPAPGTTVENGFRTGPGRVDRNRQVLIEEDGHNYEIGGDEFAPEVRLKLIGLIRSAGRSRTRRHPLRRPIAGRRRPLRRIGESERSAGSNIAGTPRRRLAGLAEAAFNSLDNVSQLFQLNTIGEFIEIAPRRHRLGRGGPLRGDGQPRPALARTCASSSRSAANIRSCRRSAAASPAPSGGPRDAVGGVEAQPADRRQPAAAAASAS